MTLQHQNYTDTTSEKAIQQMSNVKLIVEAMETADMPYMHPTKAATVNASHPINDILPQTDTDKNYLKIITGNSYKLCVDKLAHYLGTSVDEVYKKYPTCGALMGIMMDSLRDVMMVEARYKSVLERLAINVVLGLPEFALFKQMYKDGHLKINAKLGAPNLEGASSLQDIEKAIQDNEEEVVGDFEPLINNNIEAQLKRLFANFITQGNAVNKSFLFNMVKEELDGMDTSLITKYGLVMAATHIAYYGTPVVSLQGMESMGAGSAQANEDGIVARGIIFPVLIHEIVKGLYDYISYDIVSQDALDKETLEDEVMQLMAGPDLYKKLYSMIPNDVSHLFPLIFKLLLQQSVDDIKEVLSASVRGKQILQSLTVEANSLMDDYTDDTPEFNWD